MDRRLHPQVGPAFRSGFTPTHRLIAALGAALLVLAGCSAPHPGAFPSATPPTTLPTPTATPGPSTQSPTPTDEMPPVPPPPTPAETTTPSGQPSGYDASISDVSAGDLGASWHEGCPLGPEDLRAVDVTYRGYDGAVHTGRLIVAEVVATDVAGIMGDLFELRFPIERVIPVDIYGADDDASMAANNTSAFNCRSVTGATGWSDHAYGEAIDLNPVANPYVARDVVLPPAGVGYLDRSQDLLGMIHDDDGVVRAFAARGWSWGGDWTQPVDYQHFSRSGG